jgi:hypothetical protein
MKSTILTTQSGCFKCKALVCRCDEEKLNILNQLQSELESYKKAKSENDERFQLEIGTLKAQNEKLISCVEFYATRGNWHEGDNKNIYLDNCIDISDCEESDGLKEGGLRARQVLKELGHE